MKLISATDAHALISTGEAYGVDVREEFEWQAGHAEQFLFNPLSNFDLTAIPTDKPIIFVCRSGNRSGQVCVALAATELDVMNLDGGMKAWYAADLPMVAVSGNPQVA